MISIFKYLKTTLVSDQTDTLPQWQEKSFVFVFMSVCIAVLPAFINSSIRAVKDDHWGTLALYSGSYLMVVLITFGRFIPFRIRAWTGILIFLVLGGFSVFTTGPTGSGRIWLFTTSVLTTLILGINSGMLILLIQLILLFYFSYLLKTDFNTWSNLDSYSQGIWNTTSITFMFLSIVSVVAIGRLIRGLSLSLEKSRETSEQLGETTRQLTEVVNVHDKTIESLKESEEKYRSMMESMDDAAFICSSKYNIEYMNPAMSKRFGHNPIGEVCYKAIYGFNEQCPWCLSKKVLNGEAIRGEAIRTEVVSPNDNKAYSISFSSIFHTDNTVSVLHVLRDITDIKTIEAKLQQAQKMEAIGVLAGGIAHDFNNILVPITGYTEMLSDDIPKDSPLRSSLDEIYAASMRAKDMVRQILTFARQEKSEVKLMKMQHIVKEALKLIRSTIPTTIDIKQYIIKECGLINADPTQIHQIVMNLATNAYHAMEETGGTMTISLKEVELNPELNEQDVIGNNIQKGIYACLTVSDTGVGIPEDVKDKIFDPFFTTKKQGKGTGLGLSSVYGIVKSCGGFIRLNSEIGKGTEFNIYLPVAESYLKKDDLLQIKTPTQGGNEQILLVDDEAVLVSLQKTMLERLGYHVTSLPSSIEALEAFRSNPDKFDMVITDMAMPSMSGDKLAVELIKIRPDIPILLCTGFSTIISEEEALSMGIKGFLMKPVGIGDIDKKIREVLDKK